MQALVNEKSWATAAVATAIVMKEEQQQQQKQQTDQHDEENNDNEEASDGCILDNSGDHVGIVAFLEIVITSLVTRSKKSIICSRF